METDAHPAQVGNVIVRHARSHKTKHTFLPSPPATPGVESLCCQRCPSWLCSGRPLPAPAVGGRAHDHGMNYIQKQLRGAKVSNRTLTQNDPQNECNKSQTWAREDVTECMAANQERADGWSGQRSTTVCLVSGECSSSCLKEEIRKIKTALTSLLSPDGH